MGDIGQKRLTRIHLESATNDWFGLDRMGRNGFDSRFREETARIVGNSRQPESSQSFSKPTLEAASATLIFEARQSTTGR